MNYYNENDPGAAEWLRLLISEGLIPDGFVDERSIVDVKPDEIAKYTQQHFFAGIGGWPLALRLAGWPDSRPVRTGSCPCQPFSQTGKMLGTKDPRHLWPWLRDIIGSGGGIPITFGEQVASPLGRQWLSGVRNDMEALGNEFGAADLCAASVRSPQIRQRLWWVAYSKNGYRRCEQQSGEQRENRRSRFTGGGEIVRAGSGQDSNGSSIKINWLGNANGSGSQGRNQRIFECGYQWPVGKTNMVVHCEDGKFRRFEPGSFPLAHGVPNRVGLLRGYGNAIVPQLAAEFIKASIEAIEEMKNSE